MKVDTIQTSFGGGEFGPALFGRTDIVSYANACETVENFLIKSSGSAISTPGTRYVATVSDSTLRTRLIKFVFNRSDTYVIELGDLYARFYTDGGQVTASAGSATEDLSALTDVISHWKMNDNTTTTNVTDAIAAHTGTLSTLSSSVSTTGIINQAFDLDGIYYVSVADHADFTRTSSTQPMSAMIWAYYESNGATQVLIAKCSTAATPREYQLIVGPTGTVSFQVFDSAGNTFSEWVSQSSIAAGWNFFGFAFKGTGTSAGDMVLYLNGAVFPTNFTNYGPSSIMSDTAADFTMGATMNGQAKWQNKIDNVAFLHSQMTAAEFAAKYLTSSTAYQITTVFDESELFDIQYTQLNDVIWLSHPNHPVQKLVRTSASEWTISDAPIVGGPFLDNNTPALTSTGVSASTITITPSGTAGTINLTVTPTNSSLFTPSGTTLGHHGSYWMVGGLAATNATTGLQEMGYVRITTVINSYTATATVIKALKAATATTNWAEGAWSSVRGYPSCVTFQERRLWLARTDYEPQKEWGSKAFIYEDFSLDTQADDDALNLPLASTESNEIQFIAGTKSLIAGTFGGAFVTNSGSSDPITPNNANASEESGFGSSNITPKKIGSFLYYVQRFGKKLREMFFDFNTDTYKAADRTILSPHILGDGVVDMDAAQNPETILYCVLTSGTLATMTREVDQELTAWSRQTTDGTYSSIAIIPSQSNPYDEAWVIVERWIGGAQKKYIEYFDSMDVPARQDLCLYLHSALTYNAYDSTSTSSATISLSASSGSVTLTSSTAYFNGGMINKRIRAIDANGNTLGEGTITATTNTTSITLSITTTFTLLAYAAGRWGVSVSTVSGLTHLAAKTVGILADGQTESLTRTVASGAVTLGSNYFVVSVGLSYDQKILTLPKEAGTPRGTAQGKLQRFNEIAFKLNRSTQGFKYGPDSSNLDDVNLAFTPSVTTLYTGVLPPQGGGIAMRGGYSRGAKIYIKNSNPLPIEILSVIGTLDTEDK